MSNQATGELWRNIVDKVYKNFFKYKISDNYYRIQSRNFKLAVRIELKTLLPYPTILCVCPLIFTW